jgi:hypothetical protein
MPLTRNRNRPYETDDNNGLPLQPGARVYEGAAMGSTSSGVRPLVLGDPFAGFAVAASTPQDTACRVRTRGQVLLNVAGVVAASDFGKLVYATDDDTFTLTPGQSVVGRVMRHVSGSLALVQFDAALPVFNAQQQIVLAPSGGDDALLMQQFVNDMAASKRPAVLGAGDFIIGSPMTWRSQQRLGKWDNKGIGLRVLGQGPENTRLLSAIVGNAPMISVSAPSSAGIGKRNYLTEIGGMSWLRAPEGVLIPAGTTSGEAFRAIPIVDTYEVNVAALFRNLYIDGFDHCITLSDNTIAELEGVWFMEFLTGVRLGFNCDVIKMRRCWWGSEQFGTSYRNNAVAVQPGFDDGRGNGNAGQNCIELDHCAMAKIGCGVECADGSTASGILFHEVFFEGVRQYFHHLGNTTQDSIVTFSHCHFSSVTINDTTQHDPTLAGYEAKIQFDGDIAVSGGKRPILTLRNCVSDTNAQPGNAWISFNNREGFITLENNRLRPSASFGIARCIRTGWQTWKSFPVDSAQQGGSFQLGDSQQAGLGMLAGRPMQVSATITPGSTYDLDVLAGTEFALTLPDGDCTINVFNFTGTPPNRIVSALTELSIVLILPASVTATRTITWGSRLKMNAATLTYGAADGNKRAVFKVKGAGFGNTMLLSTAGPVFASA